MTSDKRKLFTVITNHELEHKESYHTNPIDNPLREKLMKFTNNEAGRKFEVQDLLKW